MVAGEEEDRPANLNPSSTTCTVIGGRGFIAESLVARLLTLGKWTVRVADSANSPIPERDSFLSQSVAAGRASLLSVDILDNSLIADAIRGSSVVFYFADDHTESDEFFLSYLSIVQGAKNVVEACRECNVRRLIYNSSSDVVFDGLHPIINGDESLPYAYKFEHRLSELKAQAESIILSANSMDSLLTCAIRPCNVFGPGDSKLIPFFVGLASSNLTKFIIGTGSSSSDFTYVENVAHAHICAEESLDSQLDASVAGKAFFISNLTPMKFWGFLLLILHGLGYHSPAIKLPVNMLRYVLLFIKWMDEKLGYFKGNHSGLHHIQLALFSRTFNCSAAQKYIGYSPVVPLKEGVARTIRSFSHLANDQSFSRYCKRDQISKVENLLGPGNVADILLWRDELKSFTCFLVLVMMFNWFFLSGRTFASSVATLVLLNVCLLYGYGVLPSTIFGYRIEKISSSYFKVPELAMEESAIEIAHKWNRGFKCIRSLAEEQQDWNFFLKITTFLFILKFVLSYSLTTIFGIALPIFFTAFFVYEQYESEIDVLAKLLLEGVEELIRFSKRNLPHSVAVIISGNGVHKDKK